MHSTHVVEIHMQLAMLRRFASARKAMSTLIVAIALPLLVWLLPTEAIPIAGISVLEHRLLAIFVMAVAFWILEPIPIFATSVLIITVQLFTISDGGLSWFMAGAGGDGFGELIPYRNIMQHFASPIIILFLGGFFLAAAATKYRLDINLARVLVKPFGTRPGLVILGMMLVTALFSMFMSNTACTAMMLAVLAPVLLALPEGDRGRTAMALAIPTAANVGGIGTPIGTPPNAVALKYLTGEQSISFVEWMGFGVPFALIMLFISWRVLLWLYRPQTERIELQISGRFQRSPQAIIVYVMFAATVLLWLTERLHGLNSKVVAMLPVAAFCATGVITAKDLKGISWDVLWLIAGGFALGGAMKATGLNDHLVAAIPFDQFAPWLILLVASLITLTMATFMSHTATANLIMPIMAGLGTALASALLPIGGGLALVLGVTFAASLGMALPISTPPNAMAHATGMVTTKQMATAGTIICLIGMVLTYAMIALMNVVGYLPK